MLNVGKNLKLSVCKSYLDLGILTNDLIGFFLNLINDNLTISLYVNNLFLALVQLFIIFLFIFFKKS